jgi:UDP-N-acetylmuramyl pentapeptide phosphotransferase/UDP-N-acetylglucosamine-1-phosphate transferase
MNIILGVFFIGLSIVFTKSFCLLAKNSKLMDKPNERSLHETPTVRGGGLVFIGLFLLSIPILGYYYHTSFIEQGVLFLGALLIALISFCDDMYHLSAQVRFGVQCIVAVLIAVTALPDTLDFALFSVTYPYLIMGFIIFITLWAINHFNFMDGLDGFCGSQAVFLFCSYALLLSSNSALFYHDLCWILVFGLIGFLVFNFPPAKLFMGDVGSATLGFISFYLALIGQQRYGIPIIYWIILNALFLFDATITLLRRMYKNEKWSAAHRKHAYQRLKQYGLATPSILLGQFCVNIALFAGILLMQQHTITPYLLVLMVLILLLTLYSLVERLYPMFQE